MAKLPKSIKACNQQIASCKKKLKVLAKRKCMLKKPKKKKKAKKRRKKRRR